MPVRFHQNVATRIAKPARAWGVACRSFANPDCIWQRERRRRGKPRHVWKIRVPGGMSHLKKFSSVPHFVHALDLTVRAD